jgi:hypothetical protein
VFCPGERKKGEIIAFGNISHRMDFLKVDFSDRLDIDEHIRENTQYPNLFFGERGSRQWDT